MTLTKPFALAQENRRKRSRLTLAPNDSTKDAVMWVFIGLIYRVYCRARLAEMRKIHRATMA